jgi:LacI family transcriptional regulator, kdg operon repressor
MDKARAKRVTIVDVAAKAGVSKTTISRYLNGKFEYMSEKSRERITGVIKEMGYRPNNLARSLKSQHSRMLGVIVSDITSPFSPILLKGISDCCERYGYRILIANSDDDPAKEREYILSMLDQQVDGIILNTAGKNTDFLMEVAKNGVPFVLADRPLEVKLFDTVRTADQEIMVELLRYLKGEGYERVGFFLESLTNTTRIRRCNAFRDTYPEIFHEAAPIYLLDSQADHETVLRRFMLENEGKRKAVYAANGVVTMHVVKAMQNLGLQFPADIGVCGFDDWDWMSLVSGGLTAVKQPTYRVGRECVKRMMHRLHRNKSAMPKNIELPCTIIVRGST